MSERQPRKSRTVPSPFHLASLVIAIAVGILVIGLLSFGALGKFFIQPPVLEQAQAVGSPTSETVEPTTEIPPADLTATIEFTATVEPSATMEISATPAETVIPTSEASATTIVESPTVVVESTQTRVRPTKTPTAALPTDTQEAPNTTNSILFESGGELYAQVLDSEGKPSQSPTLVFSNLVAKEKVTLILPSPNHTQAIFFVEPQGFPDSDGTWSLHVFYPRSGETKSLLNSGDGISAPKIFGWHPNNKEIVFATDDGKIGLLNVNTGERRIIGETQKWANLPYAPQIDGIAFSPDERHLIASFTLTGQGWEVWQANADSSEPTRLFTSEVGIFGFSWSPTGQKIAFVGNGVEVMGEDGSDRRTVASSFVGGMPPVWSPDGRLLAFTAEAPPKYKVQLVDLESGKGRNLVDDGSRSDALPTWSTDGKNVIFRSDWTDEEGAGEIWITNTQGTEVVKITPSNNKLRIVA